MIRIIKEAKTSHHVEHSLNFDTSPSGGFAFPCNDKGEVLDLNPTAQKNYEGCLSGEIKTIRPPYIHERVWAFNDPAVGECYCGAEVELSGDSEGLCYCHCGACYNTAGQSIRPRSEWEEDY